MKHFLSVVVSSVGTIPKTISVGAGISPIDTTVAQTTISVSIVASVVWVSLSSWLSICRPDGSLLKYVAPINSSTYTNLLAMWTTPAELATYLNINKLVFEIVQYILYNIW